MNEQVFTYKSSNVNHPIPSCFLEVSDLKRLYHILKEYAKKAEYYEISKMSRNEGQTEDDFEKAKENAKKLFDMTIFIATSKGEYIFSKNISIFDDSNLPESINMISFDNSIDYKHIVKADPQNKFKIDLDFTKPYIFDFVSGPSEATPNKSLITINGQDRTWTSGLYSDLLKFFEEHSTKRNFLHRSNVYDWILWFLIAPLALFNLYKIELIVNLKGKSVSMFFVAVVYFYLFIIFLFLYRALFNYSKWIFPKVELNQKGNNNKHWTHRVIIVGAVSTLIFGFIHDLVVHLLPILFKLS